MVTFNPVDSFARTSQVLGLVARRQKLLTENVANVDTPNYVRQDIDFATVLGNANGPMETQLSRKMGTSAILDEDTGVVGVNVADELIGMQENSLIYTMATRRMSNVINMMKTAVNVGK